MKAIACAAIGIATAIGAVWFRADTSAIPQSAARTRAQRAKDVHIASRLLNDLSDGTIGKAMRPLAPSQIGGSITFPESTSENPAQLLSLDDDRGNGKFWLGSASGKVNLPKSGEVHLALANSESEAFNLLSAIQSRGIQVIEIPIECLSDRVVIAAAGVPGVHGLKIYGGQLNQGLVHKLADFPKLDSLILMNVAADPSTYLRILELKQLTQLKCIGMSVSKSFISGLQNLPNIQDIDLSDCRLPANAAEELASIKTLRILNLANTGLTDTHCISLSKAHTLNDLGLQRNEISDAGVAALQNLLPNLSRLDISYTNITDAITSKLARTNISKFRLEGTAISDKGARNFRNCKTLDHLVLDDTVVSDAEINALQRKYPLAKIQ